MQRKETTMPPHCDALDGPVVKAARRALDAGDVALALPYVHKEGESEVIRAFERVLPLRADGAAVRELADLYFFETVVRVHRAGEGAPYTGLKPAGLDVGPVIPVAERAIETDSADGLETLLTDIVAAQARQRFEHLRHLKAHADHGVEAARAYVEAMLGLQVWSHRLFLCAQSDPHEGGHEHTG
jgi:hypothetical protein